MIGPPFLILWCSSPLPALHQESSVVLGSSMLSGFHAGFQKARGEETITALRSLCQLQVINPLKLSKSILAVFSCFISASKRCYLLCFSFSLCTLLMPSSASQSEFLNPTTTAQKNPLKSTKPIHLRCIF